MATPKTTSKEQTRKKTETAAAETVRELPLFSNEGKAAGTVALPKEIFETPWRADLVHQVVTALEANKRQNRAHTKDRSEVSGGGKKPWKQKGTGQARHGSTRSPIWRHGGITFGPRNTRDYHEKVNKKMRVQALYSVLARKARDGEIIAVEKLSFGAPKTAAAKKMLATLADSVKAASLLKKKNAALFALASHDANAIKSFRNMGSVETEEARNLNPLLVLSHKYLIIEDPETTFKTLIARSAQ